MHYTEYFSMRHYAGFSRIGSHIPNTVELINFEDKKFEDFADTY